MPCGFESHRPHHKISLIDCKITIKITLTQASPQSSLAKPPLLRLDSRVSIRIFCARDYPSWPKLAKFRQYTQREMAGNSQVYPPRCHVICGYAVTLFYCDLVIAVRNSSGRSDWDGRKTACDPASSAERLASYHCIARSRRSCTPKPSRRWCPISSP